MILLRLLCLASLVYTAQSCLGKKPKGNVWQRLVGNDVTPSPYNGAGDHPVKTCDELNCNFDSACCWSNANSPTDMGDFVTLTGVPEPKKMKSSFGTESMPEGTFAGVGTETGTAASAQNAQFYSCPISCVEGPVTVSLNHWQTKDVTLQVCQEDSPDGPPTDCQPLQKTSGQVDTATLPGGQNKRVVIVATGFTQAKGSVAMVDNIQVTCTPCGAAQPVEPQKPAPGGNPCTKISCDFESGSPCSYNTANVNGGNKQWETVHAPFQNPLTGVPHAANGQSFAGSWLAPGDSSVMTTDVNYPENYVVKFSGYRATEGVDLQACCGSLATCPFSTTNQVQVSDYKSWRESTITCPSGTNKVIFQAKNSGKNFGAAGLDNIHLLVPGQDKAAC